MIVLNVRIKDLLVLLFWNEGKKWFWKDERKKRTYKTIKPCSKTTNKQHWKTKCREEDEEKNENFFIEKKHRDLPLSSGFILFINNFDIILIVDNWSCTNCFKLYFNRQNGLREWINLIVMFCCNKTSFFFIPFASIRVSRIFLIASEISNFLPQY